MGQVEGRMRLHDQRFDKMLEVGGSVRRAELLELEYRLEALERRSDPPAA